MSNSSYWLRATSVIHPLLFAYFPVLYLYSNNVAELDSSSTLRATIISVSLSLLTWLIINVFYKNIRKSAIVTSVLLLLLFSFSTLYNLNRGLMWGEVVVGNQKNLAVLFIMLFAVLLYVVKKISLHTQLKLTKALNVMGALLLSMPILTILLNTNSSPPSENEDYLLHKEQASPSQAIASQTSPDIYYIILDGYGREDILRELHGFDNSSFIKALENRGFYVAHESVTNYSQTFLSLASSLNFDYFNHTTLQEQNKTAVLKALLLNSRAVSFLKSRGYEVVSTASGHASTTIRADLHLSPSLTLNEFEAVFLTYTPLPGFLNGFLFKKLFAEVLHFINMYEMHRERIRFAFREIGKVKRASPHQPLFVISHILLAHPPFVFEKDGSPITPTVSYSINHPVYHTNPEKQRKKYMANYTKQVIYGNKQLLIALDEVLKDSTRPKVIILQGDHGPMTGSVTKHVTALDIQERMPVLNAYYFSGPNEANAQLYNSISPVNTFRVIFNTYFGQDFKLIEDKSYYLPYSHHSRKFTDVTHLLQTSTKN